MYKRFAGIAGALFATFLCAAVAMAQDYTVPVTAGSKTYTLTVSIIGSTVAVTSNAPELKVGAVQLITAPAILTTTSSAGAAAAPPSQDQQTLLATAVSIEYDDLFRNNEQHVGKVVRYTGKIVQYGELSCLLCADPGHYLRVAVTPLSYGFYDDPIYVIDHSGERFLEDDIVTVWGTVDGLESYTAVLGNEVTIPRIKALSIVLGKASNPKPAGLAGQPSANRDANLRGGPETSFAIVGSVDAGQALAIEGRNADSSWFELSDGAWIAAFLVDDAPESETVPLAPDIPQEIAAAPATEVAAAQPATSAAVATTEPTESTELTATSEPAPTPAAASNTSGFVQIGQEIEVDGWRFKVAEVHKRKTVYVYDNAFMAMGHFLIVIVEATNLQSGTDYFDRNIDPWITDGPGNVYPPSSSGSSRAQWQYGGLTSPYENINPGNFARIAIAYDLPDSVGAVLLSTDVGKWVELGDFSAMTSEDN